MSQMLIRASDFVLRSRGVRQRPNGLEQNVIHFHGQVVGKPNRVDEQVVSGENCLFSYIENNKNIRISLSLQKIAPAKTWGS
jgi:hypothetical protein